MPDVSESRIYGDAVAHSLGVTAPAALATRSLRTSQIAMTRISCGPAQLGRTPSIPPEDSFIIALYLDGLSHHELWSRGRRVLAQGYAPNAMRIVNLVGEYSAHIAAPHETVCFYIPRRALDDFTDEAGGSRVADLSCAPGVVYPVVAHLGAALLPAFRRPGEAGSLFVDHLAAAVCAHVAQRYGGFVVPRPVARGGLSTALERRATAFLAAHFAKDVHLEDVAAACGLSRGHLIRAFKLTTGVTPHKWLQRYRIEQAKALLRDSETAIAEIALACGFADQSHLTRVFSLLVGTSPGSWRRSRS